MSEIRYTLAEAVSQLNAAGVETCIWPGIALDPLDADAAVADPDGFWPVRSGSP